MTYALFIDDERFPPEVVRPEGRWVIARSSEEAIRIFKDRGPPAFISFDHDLGGEDTSMRFVNWLIDICLDLESIGVDTKLIKLPAYTIHSQNPVGAEAIRSKLEAFKTYLTSLR